MTAARHRCLASALLLGSLLPGCDGPDPVAPSPSAAKAAAPPSLTASPVSPKQIDLGWQDYSDNETGYEVYRSTTGASGTISLWATTGANVTSYSDLGLSALSEYCYQVAAFRTAGRKTSYSERSNIACATTLTLPAPSGADAKPAPWQRVDVTWMDNSTTEDGFRVERSLDGSTWITAGTVGPNVTSFSDSERASEQQVCYRVIAFQAQTPSPPSPIDCTTPPAAPTGLIATAVDPQTIDLAWIDNSAVEDGYEVQRNTDVFGAYTVIANLPQNAVSYRDAGLAGDATYFYRVRAKKDGGVSDFSMFYASAVLASTPPNAPSGTGATPRSSSVVDLTWVDNSANEEGFRVQRSTDDGASWASAGTTRASETGFTDDARSGEQQVCYRVLAFNRVGDSPPSSAGCTTPPAGPTNLTATAVDSQTIELSWTDNSSIDDGYEVHRVYWGDYNETQLFEVLPPNSTAYRLPTWACGEFVVRARSGGGFSDFSNSAFGRPCPPIND